MAMLVVARCDGVWWWVSAGWLMTSKEIYPRFYIRSLISCEHEKPQVATAYRLLPGLPILSLFSFHLSLDAQPVPSLSSFSPPFYSSSSHLAGNPISNRQFHDTRALVDVCTDFGLHLPLTAPVRCLSSFLTLFVHRILVLLGIQSQLPVPLSTGPRLRCR